jgi:hypothetical protein
LFSRRVKLSCSVRSVCSWFVLNLSSRLLKRKSNVLIFRTSGTAASGVASWLTSASISYWESIDMVMGPPDSGWASVPR